jgi:hypothetical protein
MPGGLSQEVFKTSASVFVASLKKLGARQAKAGIGGLWSRGNLVEKALVFFSGELEFALAKQSMSETESIR